ncbi:MAG: aminotransferase class V-fold PLP-dependent enzyme [Caldilineaceae bacterium]
MKSVLRPGDRVLAVASGLFGFGFGEMAQQRKRMSKWSIAATMALPIPPRCAAARRFRPQLITMVHCETPSGTLNPLAEVGEIAQEVDALYYVDFVASAGGVAVDVDACHIDLGLLGSQKVLSLMPDLSMVSVSPRAWARCAEVNYVGYDALLPWQNAMRDRYMPYTHNWHALAGLEVAIQLLLDEGLEAAYARHAQVAAYCRQRLQAMHVELFPADEAYSSPTVTAAKMPAGWTWSQLDAALRQHGMAVGGNYGALAGKVFRIGHMGNQARMELVKRGMDVLEEVLEK